MVGLEERLEDSLYLLRRDADSGVTNPDAYLHPLAVGAEGDHATVASVLRRVREETDQAGWEPPYASPRSEADSLLNRLYATTYREWDNNAWDALMHNVAMRHLSQRRPRVVFIGYGETDEWAHARRYDRLLRSARAVDDYLRELWTFLQSHPHYRGRTTVIVTTDHGRGRTPRDWTDHGRDVDGAEEMWLAVIGPDTPALGERRNAATVTQAQIASTIAMLLGLGYRRAEPRAADPIGDVVKR